MVMLPLPDILYERRRRRSIHFDTHHRVRIMSLSFGISSISTTEAYNYRYNYYMRTCVCVCVCVCIYIALNILIFYIVSTSTCTLIVIQYCLQNMPCHALPCPAMPHTIAAIGCNTYFLFRWHSGASVACHFLFSFSVFFFFFSIFLRFFFYFFERFFLSQITVTVTVSLINLWKIH